MTRQTTVERLGNLPTQLTHFVGRSAELAAIASALEGSRLVTLCGPGGVGKSRLALQAATAIRDSFWQQAWLVELSGVRDPELLPRAVAMSFGMVDEAGDDPRQAIVRQVAESELLLILDTCEHLTQACADLAQVLLADCPDLRVLATSREPLGVPGERVIPVAPLDAATPESDAVQLFLDRARATAPRYRLTPANSAAVVRLCQGLDGIPLAIELAAVRLRSMSAQEIADRLDDRFKILGTARTSTDRHRTLRAAVDWSYGLCSPQEQRLWARLTVFPGSFSAAAAETVGEPGTLHSNTGDSNTGDPNPGSAGGTLAGLVAKSIVTPVDGGIGPGPSGDRYRLLDTIREFGAEHLSAEEAVAAGRVHRDHYLIHAERAAEHTGDRDQVTWMARMRLESGNLDAALAYSFATPGEAGAGVRLALALRRYWMMLGRFGEGRRWHEKAIAAAAEPSTLAWASYGAGLLAALQVSLDAAGPLLERAAAELGDADLAAYVADAQSIAAFYGGEYDTATELGELALAHFRTAGLRDATALVSACRLACVRLAVLDLERADELCDETIALSAETGEQWASSSATWVRGATRWLAGDPSAGIADALATLAVKESLGDVHTTMSVDLVAVCLTSRGGPGDLSRAATLYGASDAQWEVLGSPLMVGQFYAEMCQDMARQCRETLGAEQYDPAWGQGRAMSLADAVDLARNDTPPPAPPGPKPLTRREREIAALVASGLGNREIARQLFLSKRTIDSHIEHIFAKLGFSARSQIVGWISDQEEAAE